MKKTLLVLMLGMFLVAVNLYAADGDLSVMGVLGVGTDAPNAKLDVRGNAEVEGSITITNPGNFQGLLLENGNSGGFVKKNGFHAPLISADTVFIGTDSSGFAFAWDTIWDGQWAYCEGVEFDTGTVNCANYNTIMTSNDHFWVWKNGYPGDSQTWCTGSCKNRRDLKFLFDGESNDGVMGFMEDEDHFFYDNDVVFNSNVGIGNSAPVERLEVAGAVRIADTTSSCNASTEGTIKYASPHFYGCDGQTWKQLD